MKPIQIREQFDPTEYKATLQTLYARRLDLPLFKELEARLDTAQSRPSANRVLCVADILSNDIRYGAFQGNIEMYFDNLAANARVPVFYSGGHSDVREAIVAIRNEAGLTRAALAEKAGIDPHYVGNLESPDGQVYKKTVLSILDVFEFYPADACKKLLELPRISG